MIDRWLYRHELLSSYAVFLSYSLSIPLTITTCLFNDISSLLTFSLILAIKTCCHLTTYLYYRSYSLIIRLFFYMFLYNPLEIYDPTWMSFNILSIWFTSYYDFTLLLLFIYKDRCQKTLVACLTKQLLMFYQNTDGSD